MTTNELAVRIYDHITSLNRHGEHWDNWDDLREVKFIESLIDNQHKPKSSPTWEDVKNAMNYASQITNNKLKYMDDYIEQLKQSKQ